MLLELLAAVGVGAVVGCLGSAGLPPPLAGSSLDPAAERSARKLYDRGVGEVGERRYEPAYAAFDSVVERYPSSRYSGISLRERGLAAYRLGRHEQAAADLRRFLEHAPGYEATDSAIVLASALQLMGEPEAALTALVRHLPERDSDARGAWIVSEAAVGGLEPGAAPEMAAELPQRAFLTPLYARAAEEVRDSDPERAAALVRLVQRLSGQGGREGGGSVVTGAPRPALRGGAVGAILPLEGRLAEVSRYIQEGARLALDELEAGEDSPRFTLEVQPEGGAVRTTTSLERLADRGVRVVIGPVESEATLAAAAAAHDRGVLLVSPTATDSTLARLGGHVVAPNAIRGELGAAMGHFAAGDLRLLRVAVIGADDDYGKANALGFRRAFEERGGQVVLEQLSGRGETNFGAGLRLARRRGAEALFMPTRSADQVLTVFSQMEYFSGGTFLMLGAEVWRDESFLRRAGGFAEGGYFVDTFSPDSRATRYWDFRAAYTRRFGRSLSSNFPAWGYDAVMLALRYLTSEEDLLVESTYVGAAATYRVLGGQVEKVPVISRIENGTPVLVALADRAR